MRSLLAALLSLAACANRPPRLAYQYNPAGSGRSESLRPPLPAPVDAAGWASLRIRIGRMGACAADLPSIHFQPARRDAQVKVNLQGVHDPSRIPVDLLESFHQFHLRLSEFERSGCLKKGTAEWLFSRVLEQLEMPSQTLYYLRYGSFPQTGYVDFDAQFRVQVSSPVKNGSFTGFETISYLVRPAKSAPGFQLMPTAYVAGPLRFPAAPAFYRLFFLTRSSASDRDMSILAAPSRDILEQATQLHLASAVPCLPGLPAGVECIAVPRHVAVTAEIPVRVQGVTVYVPLNGRVSDALAASGEKQPAKVVPTLRILRPHEGKLIPVRFDTATTGILSMLLIGGEHLTW